MFGSAIRPVLCLWGNWFKICIISACDSADEDEFALEVLLRRGGGEKEERGRGEGGEEKEERGNGGGGRREGVLAMAESAITVKQIVVPQLSETMILIV